MEEISRFLQLASDESLETLYADHCVGAGVLRCIPDLARHILLRVVFTDDVVQLSVVRAWCVSVDDAEGALFELRKHRMIVEGEGSFSLHPVLKKTLRHILGDTIAAPPFTLKKQKVEPDRNCIQGLVDSNGVLRPALDVLLSHLVDETLPESVAVANLLSHAGLCNVKGESLSCTAQGFRFLLKNLHTQLWFLASKICTLDPRALEADVLFEGGSTERRDQLLCLMFQLSAATVGQTYSASHLTPVQKSVFPLLTSLGVIWREKNTSPLFVPTIYAQCLRGGELPSDLAASESFIAVESNFRVCSSTSSALSVKLVNFFCEPLLILPGVSISLLTREKVHAALHRGLTAQDIRDYLMANSRKDLVLARRRKMLPAVPVVVLDAIQHWSQELHRVHFVDVTCFRFRNLGRYEECRALLESKGWVVAASWHHVSSLPEMEQGNFTEGKGLVVVDRSNATEARKALLESEPAG